MTVIPRLGIFVSLVVVAVAGCGKSHSAPDEPALAPAVSSPRLHVDPSTAPPLSIPVPDTIRVPDTIPGADASLVRKPDLESFAEAWRQLTVLVDEGDRTAREVPFDPAALAQDRRLDAAADGVTTAGASLVIRSVGLTGLPDDQPVEFALLVLGTRVTRSRGMETHSLSVPLYIVGPTLNGDVIAAAQRVVDSVPVGARFVAVADSYDPFTGLSDLRSIRMIAFATDEGVLAVNTTRVDGLQPLQHGSLDELWETLRTT